MSNARFRGLGHVFSFTLGQMVKSRANIVSAVILLVMALVSVPLIQLTNGHGSVGPDVPAIVEQDGLTDAQRDILSSGITVITDDIAAPDEAPADELDGADDSMDGFWVQYGYAIVVMMLCMMSTAFLLRAVVEEKESKLVELLMVSVSPLALLGGKILAVMLYVAALLLLVLLGMGGSVLLAGLLFGPGTGAGGAVRGTAVSHWRGRRHPARGRDGAGGSGVAAAGVSDALGRRRHRRRLLQQYGGRRLGQRRGAAHRDGRVSRLVRCGRGAVARAGRVRLALPDSLARPRAGAVGGGECAARRSAGVVGAAAHQSSPR